jgi:hypothetical protein
MTIIQIIQIILIILGWIAVGVAVAYVIGGASLIGRRPGE